MYYGQCPFLANNSQSFMYPYQMRQYMRNDQNQYMTEPHMIDSQTPMISPHMMDSQPQMVSPQMMENQPQMISPQMMENPLNMHYDAMDPAAQLDNMYPRVYRIISPEVARQCDMLDNNHGDMYIPTRDEVNHMVDDIYEKVETEVTDAVKEESREFGTRQLGFGGRGLLRGLIGTILLDQLIGRRRRRPHYGVPYGYPYGYPQGYPYGW